MFPVFPVYAVRRVIDPVCNVMLEQSGQGAPLATPAAAKTHAVSQRLGAVVTKPHSPTGRQASSTLSTQPSRSGLTMVHGPQRRLTHPIIHPPTRSVVVMRARRPTILRGCAASLGWIHTMPRACGRVTQWRSLPALQSTLTGSPTKSSRPHVACPLFLAVVSYLILPF